MKHPDSPQPPRFAFRPAVLATFLALLFPLRGFGALAAADDYDIKVRSSVERAYTAFSKEPYKAHGKSYAIIQFQQIENDTPLAKPVNKVELFKELQKNLSAYGFHEPAPGENPEIVLTVLYGRSWLKNPYIGGSYEVATSGQVHMQGQSGSSGDPFAGSRVFVTDAQAAFKEKTIPNYWAKVQAADAEQLCIAVTAWKFPATRKEKPVQIWRTIMLIGDPGRDLNLVSDKMLAAGAAYFDHPIEKEEIAVASKDAYARVIAGTPTVVEPAKPGK